MRKRIATGTGLFGIGYLSIGTQVYLLREYTSVYGGNEFITGFLLALWMLLTGCGALAGRYARRPARFPELLALAAAALLSGIFMLTVPVLLKLILVPTGSSASLADIAITAMILLVPFCFTSGFLFVRFCSFNSEGTVATAYAVESAGSIVAGSVAGALILSGGDTSMGIKTIAAGSIVSFGIFATAASGRFRYWHLAVTLLLLLMLLWPGFDIPCARPRLFPGQKPILGRETPYGRVDITLSGTQKNFYGNGGLLFSENNEMMAEEDVHPAMVQVSNPHAILMISGGFSGTLAEVLKYKPVSVDYVELNPALLLIAEQYTQQINDRRINVYAIDPRRFLRETQNRYDVILVNLPPPATLQMNRMYTIECIREMKTILKPGGVVAYVLNTTGEYSGKASANLNSVVFSCLQSQFKNVRILPLIRNHLLASDSSLTLNITDRIDSLGIPAVFVNRHYIDQRGVIERARTVESKLNREILRNEDFRPAALIYGFAWWLDSLGHNPFPVIMIPAALLILLIVFMNPVTTGLFTGGFTMASLEILLIFTAQIWLGYAFQLTSLIILASMTGLAAGALFKPIRRMERMVRYYISNQILLSLSALGTTWLIMQAGAMHPGESLMHIIIFTAAFLSSFLTGISFRFATELVRIYIPSVAPVTYSADLFGAAAGSFIITLVVFPLTGLLATGIFIALLNVLGTLQIMLRHRNSLSL